MADQALFDVLRAWDANGYAAPMATATFYATGTLTEIDVYVDAAQSTLSTNPVAADGNGIFPQRYLAEAARAIIRDAGGVTLYDLDPVPTVLTSFGSASQVSFSPTANIPVPAVQPAIELIDTNWRAAVAAAELAAQPLDADLTAIAAIAGVSGDIIVRGATVWERKAKGTSLQRLRMNLAATAQEYAGFWDYASAAQVIAANTTVTVTHSLGARPSHCMVKLVCTSADANYPVGAEIFSAAFASAGIGLGLWTPNTTQISIRPATVITVADPAGTTVNLDLTKWQAVILANL